MITDRRWQRAMIAGLELEALFKSEQLGIPSVHPRIRQSQLDVNRAVFNIRSWRAYLPEACVTAMIKDGWQWSGLVVAPMGGFILGHSHVSRC
jgi:hypothetical protein